MRSVIVLCILSTLTFAAGNPTEPTQGIFFASDEIPQDSHGEVFEGTDLGACTIGWCLDVCLSRGFRPPFTARCSGNTCTCIRG